MRARLLLSTCLALAGLGAAGPAEAQIYKYTQGDGTVVYTDKLSDLPAAKRAHYNRQEEAAKKRREALVNMLGKEEVEKREAEAERARVQRADMAEAERKRRLDALDNQLELIRKRNADRDKVKEKWQKRIKQAKAKLQEKLQAFRKTQESYRALATKASYTLLPGQAKKRDDLKGQLTALEGEIDALVREIYVTIPDEARKAGIPPGWLR